MGRLDTMTKEYLSHSDIFADAFNFLIYGGRQVIRPEQLRELDTTEIALPYGTDCAGEAVQKYRDVLKGMTSSLVGMEDDSAAYLILGIESQSDVHYAMPVKAMLYDALQYARQAERARESYRRAAPGERPRLTAGEFLSGFRKTDRLVPVITLVLYFGAQPWDGPLSIFDMLSGTSPELAPYIQDYKINLIAPSRISDDDFTKFSTGLGAALRCVKHSQDEDLRILAEDAYKNLDLRTAMLIREISGMAFDLQDYEQEGTINMCKAYENMCKAFERSRQEALKTGRAEGREEGRAEGREEGREEGRAEGREEGRAAVLQETAQRLDARGMNPAEIAEIVDVSEKTVRQWLNPASA